jgi:hypothetical protein
MIALLRWAVGPLAALLVSGCATVSITPAKVASAPVPIEERSRSLTTWTNALDFCNGFLASPFRQTLPEGRVCFTNGHMVFVCGKGALPVRIRCTAWGDLAVWSGTAVAQERSDGFVVGSVAPRRNRLLENTFFKTTKGQPIAQEEMASMILHELTHSYYRVGTVSPSKAIGYYAEAILLLRSRNHCAERLPNKTSAEFAAFFLYEKLRHPPRTPRPQTTGMPSSEWRS